MNQENLLCRIGEIRTERNLTALSVAVHDYQTGRSYDVESDRWFHAASVIKLAVLLGVFKAVDDGRYRLDDPVHVRNRFRSVADFSLYRLEGDRDGDAECYRRVGRTMQIVELSRAMIVRSSNLATNLLLELIGLDFVRGALEAAGVDGVKIVRGVEDHVAFERGINNEMTTAGARRLLRVLHEGEFLRPESCEKVREILLAQELNAMIPSRLPKTARVAHKTGEISNHSHDAGVVFPADHEPYVIAIFTEGDSGADQRSKAVAEISEVVFGELRP
jgi:beta-lactamase class A